jgi:hypothetical protein
LGRKVAERLASGLELQRTAIRSAVSRMKRPHRTSQHPRGQRESSHAGHDVHMDPCARTQRAFTLHEGSARTEIDDTHAAARTKRRANAGCGERDASFRTAIGYLLIHVRCPESYLRTRVRPVAPRTRTAYCARRPSR